MGLCKFTYKEIYRLQIILLSRVTVIICTEYTLKFKSLIHSFTYELNENVVMLMFYMNDLKEHTYKNTPQSRDGFAQIFEIMANV